MHNDGNRINPKGGLTPIVIYSTADFDAIHVDVASLKFGRTGDENSLAKAGFFRPKPIYFYADVNGNGMRDLVVFFDASRMGFQVGDDAGILTGATKDGQAFDATTSVAVQSPRKSPLSALDALFSRIDCKLSLLGALFR